MKYRYGTDIGLKRDENQDSVRCEYFGNNVLAVVCDGMGGEVAGREASSLAAEEFFHHFAEGYHEDIGNEELEQLLKSSVSAANTVIYTKARLDYSNFGMGTTCVAAFVMEKSAFIANVGDSRAYLITDSGLKKLTTDHNVATLLYEQGKITAEELEHHPQKHMLIRAVGVDKTVSTDIFYAEVKDKETDKINLLLCSDGLSGYCSDEEIYDVISHNEFDGIPQALINLALSKGGRDNVTVAVVSE